MPQHSFPPFEDLHLLPHALVDHILRLTAPRNTPGAHPLQRAVFDLDNTLLVGDLGDAVFAQLLRKGHRLGLQWNGYRRLARTDAPRAWVAQLEAMKGLPRQALVQATREILSTNEPAIVLHDAIVPVPRPHAGMRMLVALLQSLGTAVYVISASSQVAVRLAISELFDIPEERGFGIRSEVKDNVLTGKILAPAPVGEGKRAVYEQFIGSDAPIVTVGDSVHDLPLLQLTARRGAIVLVGDDREHFERLRRKLPADRLVAQVHRSVVRSPAGKRMRPGLRSLQEY